ncbi:flocculation protein FLO11-like [Phragmites australis]|uniref:flocculation protein FLO11-like n=1 Tax=Phragmites australis TaxID=29695 RepID=UPI002D7941D0|nr:flocculation protein FLO11-like [Phragmites australis]
MGQETPAFKPQWLMQPLGTVNAAGAASLWAAASSRAGKGGSSSNHSSGHDCDRSSRQSSSPRSSGLNGSRQSGHDGIGKSRGYANFGRNKERDRGKDFNSRDRESRSVAADHDGFESFSTCRPERDRLTRTRLKGDTWSKGVVSLNNGSRSNADVSSSTRSNDIISSSESNTDVHASVSNAAISASVSTAAVSASVSTAAVGTSRNNAIGIAFEREFPALSSEDKNRRQGVSKVPSPGISTPIQNVPLVNTSDGWNSVLADIPMLNDTKKSPDASSVLQTAPSKQTEAVPKSGSALSMAETVMQVPLRISIGPQLSIEAQKIEERTLRQYALRPLTPPSSKSSVLSSSKTKTARTGDPSGPSKTAQQLKIQSANGSVRAPVKTDISKLSQSGSFQVLSREQNGTACTSKDCHSNPFSPPTPLVSMEPQKKPVVSQKFKIATHELPLPLQGPCGDRKSNAKDKLRFFEMLRTKSSNGSSTAFESGCQPFPSSLVDAKQDSSLNLRNDFSLVQSGMKCMGNGNCFCGEANSSEGSQRHLSDNEENISSLKPEVADGLLQLLVQKREVDSSSEPADTGDEEFQLSLSDSAESGSSSAPADSDDGCNRTQSGNEEARSSSEDTESGDEDHPAEPPPEDKSFLIALGWREDEVVEPLGLEEIADSVKGCEELAKKLWSMKSNANVQIILLSIFGQS